MKKTFLLFLIVLSQAIHGFSFAEEVQLANNALSTARYIKSPDVLQSDNIRRAFSNSIIVQNNFGAITGYAVASISNSGYYQGVNVPGSQGGSAALSSIPAGTYNVVVTIPGGPGVNMKKYTLTGYPSQTSYSATFYNVTLGASGTLTLNITTP